MSTQPEPIREGAVCLNMVARANGLRSAICHCCGLQSRAVTTCRDGEPDLFAMARGWSMAPYPIDFRHQDGSVGSWFTCPSCNKRLRGGERLISRAYLRGAA